MSERERSATLHELFHRVDRWADEYNERPKDVDPRVVRDQFRLVAAELNHFLKTLTPSATLATSQWRKVDSTTPHKNEPLIVMTDSGHVCEADNFCGHWNMPRAYQDDVPVWWMLCPGEPK